MYRAGHGGRRGGKRELLSSKRVGGGQFGRLASSGSQVNKERGGKRESFKFIFEKTDFELLGTDIAKVILPSILQTVACAWPNEIPRLTKARTHISIIGKLFG